MTNRDIRRVGVHFAFGVIAALCIWLGSTLIIVKVAEELGLRPLDATDARDGTRSGVKLRTDHGTGCQYLETADGGITPRLDPTGRQVCR